ncbi:hypothetical protein [Corynebacterium lowii]|uniref:Uncharacterized protein n=1 Tax=Corynebacterium lowii TaxID=1544413 RepID=A0A0Q1AJU9_9CORY|nr:hypothetical protein [Corynebacterium lowii]KQB87151.1 hypothetical protein Clow_00199 [Corynebacterium lowii]MDP9852263.1 hypothetical protein [Corynebacterium lowii]
MTQTDYYSLDDTRAGRLTQAAFAGIWEALPDYVSSPLARRALKALLLSGGVSLVAYLNSVDEDPNNHPSALLSEVDLSPKQTWAILGGGLLGGVLTARMGEKVRAGLVRHLRRRGLKRPHTALGVAAAVVVFGLSEAQARR